MSDDPVLLKGDASDACQLYRHYDPAGALLYIGISLSAVARLSQHGDKPWKL